MKICILTRAALAANPRVTKEAQALANAGHDVTIVCGKYSSWSSKFEAAAAPDCVTIRSVTYGRAAPRATRLAQIVRRKAARGFLRCIRHNASLATYAGCDVTPGLIRAAISIPAHLYIAHYNAALPAAAAGARANGGAYAFDAEDYHPGDALDLPENELENHIIHVIESRYLPGCRYITAASPGIAQAYAKRYNIPRPEVVLNVFPKTQAPTHPTHRGSFSPSPSLYWFSQIIGPDRGLETAIAAIAAAKSAPHLVLRGTPSPGYADHLRNISSALGVPERLHFLGPAEPQEMERLASSFDLGFVGEAGSTHNRRIALTNKQFTYLLAGLPAIMSDVPAHVDFQREAQGAVWIYSRENVSSLAGVLDRLLLEPRRLAEARERAFQLGQARFNWDIEQAHLLRTVERAVRQGDVGLVGALR